MATRSLTEVFILMRNNALQSRNIFSDQQADDCMALVNSVDVDLESGSVSTRSGRLPPEWVDGVEEIQYEMTKIKQKMKELASFHDKHLTRPAFDDNVDEEQTIEIVTQEITQMFSHCQRLIQQITARSQRGTNQELKLSQNIIMSLVRSMQEMSNNFRKSQSTYLRKLQSREERSQFFDSNIGPETGLLSDDAGMFGDPVYDKVRCFHLCGDPDEMAREGPANLDLHSLQALGFSTGQLQLVEENTQSMQRRETEIVHIVRSIQDLNDIFKDLAIMVVDQGTILDRIDYNVEHASTQVDRGLKQLQKAETYQKKNKKMYIIAILAIIIVLLIVILIGVKS